MTLIDANVDPDSSAHDVENEVELALAREIPQLFEINSNDAASWLLRKIRAARQYGVDVALWAEREKRRAKREEEQLLFLFGDQLRRWTESQLSKARKSICLPGGTVGFRAASPLLVIDDEAKVIVWAKSACPSAVIVCEHISKAILNEHFRATGQLPEVGAHFESGQQRFFIR